MKRLFLFLLMFCGLMNSVLMNSALISSAVMAQEPQPFLPVAVKTSLDAERELALILDDWQAGRFVAIVKSLTQFRDHYRNSLVMVDDGHVLRGERVFDVLSLQLPFEARRTLLEQIQIERMNVQLSGQQSKTLLSRMADPRETPKLLVDADLAWRNGEIATARKSWHLLASPTQGLELRLPKWRVISPDAKRAGDSLARLILADITNDRLDTARVRLDELVRRFPLRKGKLAGRQGHWEEILNELLKESEFWSHDQFSNPTDTDWLPGEEVRIDFTRQKWSVPLTPSHISMDRFGRSQTRPQSRAMVHEDVVLINDANGLRALDVATGRSAWPYDDEEPGFLLETNAGRFAPAPALFGKPSESGVIINNHWLGCVDQQLVSFDLNAEGRLDWSFPAGELSGSVNSKDVIASRPVGIGTGIVVAVQSPAPVSSSRLICRGLDGKSIWQTEPIDQLPLPAGDRQNIPDSLSVFDQTVYWNADGSTVLAIEATTGTILWLRQIPDGRTAANVSRIENDIRADAESVLAINGHHLTSFEPATGATLWQCSFETPVSRILGVCDGVVIVSGRQLWGVDLFNGRILWKAGGAKTWSQGFGTGLLLGRSVLWPTMGELWTVDAKTGRPLQRDEIRRFTGNGGGTLTLDRETLLIATAETLTAYGVLIRAHENRLPERLPSRDGNEHSPASGSSMHSDEQQQSK